MVSKRYSIIVTEGPHDQAAVGKAFEVLGMDKYQGEAKDLDPFWDMFRPIYPKKGNLYYRLDMPSIYHNENSSVAVHCVGGSGEIQTQMEARFTHEPYRSDIFAFGLVLDADDNAPVQVAKKHAKWLKQVFPGFPDRPGIVDTNTPRTGIFVFPDNTSRGVLDNLLLLCAEEMYVEYKNHAENYIQRVSTEIKDKHTAKLSKRYNSAKATVAAIASILKPGATNTASISQDQWICEQTATNVPAVSQFITFLGQLLDIST